MLNMNFNLLTLPVEIRNIIVCLSPENSQAALYSSCSTLRNEIDEQIFQVHLRSLHLPKPNEESHFSYLMKHYKSLSRFLMNEFNLEKPQNVKNIINLKEEMVVQSCARVTPTLQERTKKIVERVINHGTYFEGGLPTLPEDDTALQFLLEAGAQPTIENCDQLHIAIAHKCKPRTIELIMESKNFKVGWAHVRNALQRNHPEEVIVSLLFKAVDLPQKPLNHCDLETLIPLILEKEHLSDKAKLLLIGKAEKIDFDIIRKIIDEISEERGKIISTQVFTALMEKVKIDAEHWHAEYLITWFWNRMHQEQYLFKMGSANVPLGVLLDKALKFQLTIEDTLRNPINSLNAPNSIFFGQEEIIYKLVCVTTAPIDCGTFEYAMKNNHSERVLLEMLRRCDQEKVTQRRTLDIAFCAKAPTAVLAKLIEIEGKIDRDLLIRALQENNSDSTIFKAINAYTGDLSFDSFYRFVGNAFQSNLSDAIINRLVAWAETALDEDTAQAVIKECLYRAKEKGRSPQLVSLIKSKYRGCILL